jgi:beta-ribofuranosylaminobenzene 5'-phosphate synthase
LYNLHDMIRVRAASRLHFGLLSLCSTDTWPNRPGEPSVPARRFGGAGLMIQEPGIELTVEPAAEWSARGPLAERALSYARNFAQALAPEVARPQHFEILRAGAEHAGLGTGTQLGLAVARGLTMAFGLPDLDLVALAQHTGRGQRSGVGIHGFAHGGFLIEGGHRSGNVVAPLVARVDFPASWRVVLIVSPWGTGLHDRREEEAFANLQAQPTELETTDSLCRLLLLGMLPALRERDLEAFGEALHDFNLRAGQAFAAVQGGPYANRQVADLVAFVRRQGIRGVGQSSWGPAVFAVTEDHARAADLAAQIRRHFHLENDAVLVTPAWNHGAVSYLA